MSTPTQWEALDDKSFMPRPTTQQALEPGIYKIKRAMDGAYVTRIALTTDQLMVLPGSPMEQAVLSIRSFWQRQARYERFGVVYKRGIFLYGPPGTGKTAVLQLLAQELVAAGGIVLYANERISATQSILQAVRQIQPTTPLILVFEDVDGLVEDSDDEEALTRLLDGENQIANVVYIATTNHPEKIPARLFNRPSRFDEVILVGAPSAKMRRTYLQKVLLDAKVDVPAREITQWVNDSEGLTLAHLREMVIAVHCLEQPYVDVLARMQAMGVKPMELPGFKSAATQDGPQPRLMAVRTQEVIMQAPSAQELVEALPEEAQQEIKSKAMAAAQPIDPKKLN